MKKSFIVLLSWGQNDLELVQMSFCLLVAVLLQYLQKQSEQKKG